MIDKLTNKQYEALLALYNEMNSAFNALPQCYKDAFFNRLFARG